MKKKYMLLLLLLVFTAWLVINRLTYKPVYLGESGFTHVLPSNFGDIEYLGDIILWHEGDKPITVTEVSLIDAKDMLLNKTYLVKLEPDEENLVGFGKWPPREEWIMPKNWDDRIEAIGGVLEPGDSWNLVVVVTSQAQETASAQGIKVAYEDLTGKIFKQRTKSVKYYLTSLPIDEFVEKNNF